MKPHPAEIDFKDWCDRWMAWRLRDAVLNDRPFPTPKEMAKEMMNDLLDGDGEIPPKGK